MSFVEAEVTIDEKDLTIGQSLSIRVAVERFIQDINEMGDEPDETYILYLARLVEVRSMLHTSIEFDGGKKKKKLTVWQKILIGTLVAFFTSAIVLGLTVLWEYVDFILKPFVLHP